MTMDTAAPALGRRERKKLETRRALRASALRLFADRGFDRTTIEDITNAADVSPRTFFLHYSSKEDVLLADPYGRFERFEAALAARPDDEDPLSMVRAATLSAMDVCEEERAELMVQARLMDECPALLASKLGHYHRFERVIGERLARRSGVAADPGGGPRCDLHASLVAASAMTVVRVALTVWYRRGGREPITELIDAAFEQLATGLAPPS